MVKPAKIFTPLRDLSIDISAADNALVMPAHIAHIFEKEKNWGMNIKYSFVNSQPVSFKITAMLFNLC